MKFPLVKMVVAPSETRTLADGVPGKGGKGKTFHAIELEYLHKNFS